MFSKIEKKKKGFHNDESIQQKHEGRASKEVGTMDSNQETGNKIFLKVQMDQ